MGRLPIRAGNRIRAMLVQLMLVAPFVTATALPMKSETSLNRPRAREAGLIIGSLQPGPLNAITDVAGVRVGHKTVTEGENIRTGVTVVFPHEGNAFLERVPAAIYVANGYGKLLGMTQVQELGELETPILLTSTLSIWRATDAMVGWLLEQPGMEDVRSVNPVAGETNDGFLNDIRARPIRPEHVIEALRGATNGPVPEGAVGAGAGTIAFGWKGGIGTSSRKVSEKQGGYTVGVIVQSNYGGDLAINGVRVADKLKKRRSSQEKKQTGTAQQRPENTGDGSIMIVAATDAPLSCRNLRRLAMRAIAGLSRTGSSFSNGSGDYVIAFSTAPECRRPREKNLFTPPDLSNDAVSPLFQAVAEATEEAIYNSLFQATTTTGFRGKVEALPDDVFQVLNESGALR